MNYRLHGYLNLPTFNYVALPKPALKAERSNGYEVGLRWSDDVLQAGVAIYENRFNDLIESRANLGCNGDGQLVFQSINRDRARTRGAELEAHWALDGRSKYARGAYAEISASWIEGDDTSRPRTLNSVPPRATLALGRLSDDGGRGTELGLSGVRRVTRRPDRRPNVPAARLFNLGSAFLGRRWRPRALESVADQPHQSSLLGLVNASWPGRRCRQYRFLFAAWPRC